MHLDHLSLYLSFLLSSSIFLNIIPNSAPPTAMENQKPINNDVPPIDNKAMAASISNVKYDSHAPATKASAVNNAHINSKIVLIRR